MVIALNKSDLNAKKGTSIDTKLLSKRLRCPVIETVSISSTDKGLKEVVEQASLQYGREQESPYHQGEVNLQDKAEVEAADRKRFDFVNRTVKEVENERFLQKIEIFRIKSMR